MASVCAVDEVLSSGYALSDLDNMSPARRFGTVTIRRLKKRKSYTGAMVAIGGTIVAIIATAGILAAGEANQFIKECGQVQVQGGLAQQSTDSLSRIVAPGEPGEPGEPGDCLMEKTLSRLNCLGTSSESPQS